MRPTWSKFWAEYPDYINFPDSEQVKKDIGGNVNAGYLTNTCAIRMSRGLNYSGVPVPFNFPGMETVKGGDGKRYAFRVADMRLWLPGVLGKPEVDLRKKEGEAFDKSTLKSQKGLLAFDIKFKDATGHMDAWDGSVFSDEYESLDYWVRAKRITLWVFS